VDADAGCGCAFIGAGPAAIDLAVTNDALARFDGALAFDAGTFNSGRHLPYFVARMGSSQRVLGQAIQSLRMQGFGQGFVGVLNDRMPSRKNETALLYLFV
jgi:hypothetical protein